MKQIEFVDARYGMFVHFGLYSAMGRGEWAVNREEISSSDLREVAAGFNPVDFDANEIADLAVAGGMKYLVFTTMHHDGFRMYHSELTNFCSTKTCGRDFVAEIVAAARARGLKVGLYHSLNNWFDEPDAVAALENEEAYRRFIEHTFARIRELVANYNPIDILWYDGWWPFDAKGWQAEMMNAMVRDIQPHILFNGRNALPGDFATPEQHLSAPVPWRPWEACVTVNDNWGFHAGDHNWKSPMEIVKLLTKVAQSKGNLLLNIGPDGSGKIPKECVRVVRQVGEWLARNNECIFGTDMWTFDSQKRGAHCGDWSNHGQFTVKGNFLYFIGTSIPLDRFIFSGLEMQVLEVDVLGGGPLPFRQDGGLIDVNLEGLTYDASGLPLVIRFCCDRGPVLYKTGGMRVPRVDHPRYDPTVPDIAW